MSAISFLFYCTTIASITIFKEAKSEQSINENLKEITNDEIGDLTLIKQSSIGDIIRDYDKRIYGAANQIAFKTLREGFNSGINQISENTPRIPQIFQNTNMASSAIPIPLFLSYLYSGIQNQIATNNIPLYKNSDTP